MARKPVRPPPPPPWVWGPSEVKAWIEGAYPSETRRPRASRRLPRSVEGLRLRCAGATRPDLRRIFSNALRLEDFPDVEEPGVTVAARAPAGRRAVVRIRPSLRRRTFLASVSFHPPVRPSVARKLVRRIRERVEVLAVAERLRD